MITNILVIYFIGIPAGVAVIAIACVVLVLRSKDTVREQRRMSMQLNEHLRVSNLHADQMASMLTRIAERVDPGCEASRRARRTDFAKCAMAGLLADHKDHPEEILDGEDCPQAVARLPDAADDGALRASGIARAAAASAAGTTGGRQWLKTSTTSRPP